MELTLVPDKRCGAYDADDVGLCNPKVSLSGFVVTCLVLPVSELDARCFLSFTIPTILSLHPLAR